MSSYPILLAVKQLVEIDGITRRCEQYKFKRGTQPGAIDVLGHRRADTIRALEARGMDTREHRTWLRSLPKTLSLKEASKLFNVFQHVLVDRGVVEEDGTVNLPHAFLVLGLDVSLLD